MSETDQTASEVAKAAKAVDNSEGADHGLKDGAFWDDSTGEWVYRTMDELDDLRMPEKPSEEIFKTYKNVDDIDNQIMQAAHDETGGPPKMENLFKEEEKTNDLHEQVNHPTHYNSTPMETIDVIQGSMTSDQFQGYLQGNIIKYVARYRYKGMEVKDLRKAEWYLKKLIEVLESCGP